MIGALATKMACAIDARMAPGHTPVFNGAPSCRAIHAPPSEGICFGDRRNEVPSQAAFTHPPVEHPTVRSRSIGVRLANPGTPQATDAEAGRRYRRELLHDHRTIDVR